MNMIGAFLILYYDINDEKAAKRMTIANSNINEKSKSAPFNTNFSKLNPFRLIYRSYESKGHDKLMLFIYVLTLIMYAGKLNRYGINYFVLIFSTSACIDTV